MNQDMLVELIAAAEFSQRRIAEIVGVSRRTVWRIANGFSRPDLQRRIAAVVEGYRQAAIRSAARHMKALLEKQVQVALEGDGETARKCREFLLKTFMLAIPDQTAKIEKIKKIEEKRDPEPEKEEPITPMTVTRIMHDLSPELIGEICKELFGPDYESQGPRRSRQETAGAPQPAPPPESRSP